MRDKLRAKARLKVSDSPEQVGIESVARRCGSDGGMKSNSSLDSKRNIRASVSVCLCSYRNGNSENSEEQESSHERCTRQPRCPHGLEAIPISCDGLQWFDPMPLSGSLSLPTVSYGTLFELSCRAEQLGRAAQPAFELSKGRTIVGGREVPNFLISDSKSVEVCMWDLNRTRSRLRTRFARAVVDEEILEQSQIARAGEKLIRVAVIIRVVEPMLVLASLMLVIAVGPALAQAPGGNIFGGSDQTVGNGVREAIRWARNILFLLGIGAVAWGTVNIFLEKPYARQFIGGGASMAFGGIASLAYSFAKGQAVDVDTDVGQ